MAERRVRVFFYGSYINLEVLKEVDLRPENVEVAMLHGFDIRVQPLANLVPVEGRTVYGILTEATHAELSELIDMEEWGRFAAFELLAQTHHYDQYHNWRLYYDPWRTRFVPIVWDPVAWTPEARNRPDGVIDADIVGSRLQAWLLMNGDFLRARH